MNDFITEEQYQKIAEQPLDMQIKILSSMDQRSGNKDYTSAFQEMRESFAKEAKIEQALSAFESFGSLSEFTSNIGTSEIKYDRDTINTATKSRQDAKKDMEASLAETSGTAIAGTTTMEELTNLIKVQTGIDVLDSKTPSEYKEQITKVLNSMKKGMPVNLFKDKQDMVNLALGHLSDDTYQKNIPIGYGTNKGFMNPRKISDLDNFFNAKKEKEESTEMLKGMFENEDLYNAWLEYRGID